MKKKSSGNPLAKADHQTAAIALDWVMEHDFQALDLVAAEKSLNNGACRMGYLRRVPDSFEQFLIDCPQIEKATVSWRYRVNYGYVAPFQTATRVCFPLAILEAMMRFLKPSGKHHLAPISFPIVPGCEICLISREKPE